MALDPLHLSEPAREFLAARHLATLTTLRADGTPHVTPVGFTWEPEDATARVITTSSSHKVRNVTTTGRVVICQVDGRHWLSLEGAARVLTGPDEVLDAERRYAVRYRPPRENPRRVVIAVRVDRVLGNL